MLAKFKSLSAYQLRPIYFHFLICSFKKRDSTINKMLISRFFSTTQSRMANKSNVDLENFVHNGRKILGAALNYMDIIRARNLECPKVPLLFLKPTSSYLQEGQDIVIPKVFSKVAHEVELGFIIGKTCKNVTKNDAMNYVGGYCLALDLTAQCELGEARANGHPWSLGKGFDTSTPVSRFIPVAEISNPHDLSLWLKVNGELRQNGNTVDLLFKIPELIEHASKYMTLEPNDLILTGTPDGAQPMAPGDIVECGMGDVAKLTFKVRAE